MAKLTILLALCQIITLPILGGNTQSSPLEDMVSSFMQQVGDSSQGNNMPGLIGQLVGTFMQGDNMKNLGSLLAQASGGRDNNAGDILSGLGSLLGGQNGQIDPSLVGNVVSMFAQQMAQQQPTQRQKRQSDNDINLEGLLSLASGFMGGQNQNGASVLPMIMNALGSLSNPEANKRAEDHKDHADFLPPFLEKAHLYWDLFINSELGKAVWEKSGMKRVLKAFTGPDGKISFDLMFKNFENQSFRRHWIKAAAAYLTDMVVHIAKPEVYQRYLTSSQYIINSFLDAQGLPKTTHFNAKKPEKSISALINHALKKYLDMDTDVTGYVKPAVEYVKQTFKMAEAASQKLASRSDYNAIADRVTDTLNLEVIEPVLRVYRAYQHSLRAPHCQEHLMCLVNKHHDQDKQGLPGFKAGLTKFSSMIASAALSFQNGKGFWDLYNAIQSDVNCEAAYPADCAAFHEHELKVTTEVYHSEL
ncbi:uncharacterized protein LOC126377099 [Pectinophora gossypiella]|uniref:uncharacterized protein LOC126377099 n=1 Tax=Pectinophora gossypiella TaxID=13191 RepID=UPI00214E2AA5|nr:uncharacterized protein LOC126377099 [Pectinophora gossypiella]XP_049880715.1 uncharacterized protein LOC126377099 [Pectinophora gossypiella]